MSSACWIFSRILFTFLLRFTLSEDLDTLRLVHLVYRHGDRSPTKTYPNDEYQEDAWPQGWGQLTQKGMMQHYNIGKFLRERYMKGYLNESYDRDEVYIRSTDKDRTLMSAYCNLAGLYPPKEQQVWKEEIIWQPIPVHTRPYNLDPMLRMGVPCDAYSEIWHQALSNDEWKGWEKDHEEFLDYVRENTGMTDKTKYDLYQLAEYVPGALLCERRHNKTTDWVDQRNGTFEKLWELKELQFKFYFYTPEMTRFRAGLFMNELRNHTQTFKDQGKIEDGRLMYIYSAHDTTVTAFLHSLGVWNGKVPEYASVLFFELHERQPKQYSMKILFKNDSILQPNSDPMVLTLKDCDDQPFCPVDKFLEILKPLVIEGTVEDWFRLCDNTSGEKKKSYSAVGVPVVVLILLIVIVMTVVVVYLYRRRKAKSNIPYSSQDFQSGATTFA